MLEIIFVGTTPISHHTLFLSYTGIYVCFDVLLVRKVDSEIKHGPAVWQVKSCATEPPKIANPVIVFYSLKHAGCEDI